MNLKKIFIIGIVVGVAAFLISGILYTLGGRELFKTQDRYDYTRNETIEKEEPIEGIETIKVNTSVGNINFKYTDEDVLKLELINPIEQSKEPISIKRDNDTLKLDINDVDNKIHFGFSKNLRSMKKCELNMLIPIKYKGNIDVSSEVGNIKGEFIGRALKLTTDVGNIEVEINEIESGEISTDVGNVKVKIKEESNLSLDANTELGKIRNNLKNTTNINNNKNKDFQINQDLKIDVNKGGSLIKIKSDLGNIELSN